MSALFILGSTPFNVSIVQASITRGRQYSGPAGYYSVGLRPGDSIGSFSLTLTNVVAGSAVQIEVATTGAVVSNTLAAASNMSLTIPVYSLGSVSNALRVKIRKGSDSPYYQPYETLATAFVGAASIYVSQISDE